VETKEALDSQDWLNVSADSSLGFLNLECLNIKEADLVRALIRWGKFQEQHGRDGENLRSKILPGLQKIRFDSVTQQELVQLFQEELGEVLSDGEKCSIFMAIISGNWSLMPSDVVSSIKLSSRHGPYTFFSLPFTADQNEDETYCGNDSGDKDFVFKFDKTVAIVGVKLNLTAPYHKLITFNLNNLEARADIAHIAIATGSVNITSLHRGEFFCPLNTIQTLIANSRYRLEFHFNGFDESSFHCGYVLPKGKDISVCDDLTLKLNGNWTLCVHVLGIVFILKR